MKPKTRSWYNKPIAGGKECSKKAGHSGPCG